MPSLSSAAFNLEGKQQIPSVRDKLGPFRTYCIYHGLILTGVFFFYQFSPAWPPPPLIHLSIYIYKFCTCLPTCWMKWHFKRMETGFNSDILPDAQHFFSLPKINKHSTINLWWVMPVAAGAGSSSGSRLALCEDNSYTWQWWFSGSVSCHLSASAVKKLAIVQKMDKIMKTSTYRWCNPRLEIQTATEYKRFWNVIL